MSDVEELPLSVDIPWKLIGGREDMMDINFCDAKFPPPWKSSVAVFAYEPPSSQLPEGICDEITYLKVSCSITGLQYSREEIDKIIRENPDIISDPQKRLLLEQAYKEYFGCFAALLNLSVFPIQVAAQGGDPVIIDRRISIDFGVYPPNSTMPANPTTIGQVKITALAPVETLDIIDIAPHPRRDSRGELAIRNSLKFELPTTVKVKKVKVKIIVLKEPYKVTLKAFSGADEVDRKQTDDERIPQVQEITLNAEKIEMVKLTVNRPFDTPAKTLVSILEFAYYYDDMDDNVPELKDYPRIIDFQPKNREFYQVATETSELLSTSNSKVATDRSFTTTNKNESKIKGDASIEAKFTDKLSAKGSFGMENTSTETFEDSSKTHIETSRELKESRGAETEINQLYTLLNSYHIGTNRALFLMLPRPHTMQPTDRRTFVRGLRIMEGIQDFFLIVAKPKGVSPGLCIDVLLDTGHFPEKVSYLPQKVEYEEDYEDFIIEQFVIAGADEENPVTLDKTYNLLRGGFVVDTRHDRQDPDPTAPISRRFSVIDKENLSYFRERPGDRAGGNLRPIELDFGAVSPSSVKIVGKLNNYYDDDATWSHRFRVLTRSELPKKRNETDLPIISTPFIISSRGLCVCFRTGTECPIPVISRDLSPGDSIVDEQIIPVSVSLLDSESMEQSREPLMKEVIRRIQQVMSISWKLPSRRPIGAMTLANSVYFRGILERIRSGVP